MRLLLIHADEFEYEVKDKAISEPEVVNAANKYHKAGNSLVAFCTVESSDGEDVDQIASNATATIIEEADAVGTRSIVLYPYAHLSSDLAAPALAMRVLHELTEKLASTGYDVTRSPFGWYKRFKISCKGHALSELSRTIKAAPLPKTVTPEKTYYKALTSNLELRDPESFLEETKDPEFRSLLEKEALKRELPGGKEPTYLRYCRKFGIQWEPYSDLGQMRFSPEVA
ncbi:MAG: threonyl-tRNA synthetase editing domain-containing protein [Candidatus Bathyarchaeia archaeon]